MPITTENTYLCTKAGNVYTKLVDIKDFPDLGGAPGTVDVTDLSCHNKKYLRALVDTGILSFTGHGDTSSRTALAAKTSGTHTFAVVFGTINGTTVTPVNGGIYFDGELSYYTKGAGVDAEVELSIDIVVNGDITEI